MSEFMGWSRGPTGGFAKAEGVFLTRRTASLHKTFTCTAGMRDVSPGQHVDCPEEE